MSEVCRIRDELNARGLEGDDLETMIDHYLAVTASEYEFWTDNEIAEDFGHNTLRLVMALRAIAQEGTAKESPCSEE